MMIIVVKQVLSSDYSITCCDCLKEVLWCDWTNFNVDEKVLREILNMDEKELGNNIKYGSERVRQSEIKY